MATQAEELLGAHLTGADGKEIGTVEQVFEDDANGTPAWARISHGKQSRFVPLDNAHVAKDGLHVPFDADQVASGPKFDADQHISAEQADELSAYYYSLAIPEENDQPRDKSGQFQSRRQDRQERQERQERQPEARRPERQQPQRQPERQESRQDRPQPRAEQQQQARSEPKQQASTQDEWLVRREERLEVGKQAGEAGHVKLHRYVETSPAEETVRLMHEEFDVERAPVAESEPVDGAFEEDEREITLRSEDATVSKKTVPVERMRLVTKQVEEEKTFRDDVRSERIEVEPEESSGADRNRRNSR